MKSKITISHYMSASYWQMSSCPSVRRDLLISEDLWKWLDVKGEQRDIYQILPVLGKHQKSISLSQLGSTKVDIRWSRRLSIFGFPLCAKVPFSWNCWYKVFMTGERVKLFWVTKVCFFILFIILVQLNEAVTRKAVKDSPVSLFVWINPISRDMGGHSFTLC